MILTAQEKEELITSLLFKINKIFCWDPKHLLLEESHDLIKDFLERNFAEAHKYYDRILEILAL